MDLHKAKELERLKQAEAGNRRAKERKQKIEHINHTVNQRSGAWHHARTQLSVNSVSEAIEDHITIRKELAEKCPDLASVYEIRQFEDSCNRTADAMFQGILNSFQVSGVHPSPTVIGEIPSIKHALRGRLSMAGRMIQLEASAHQKTPQLSSSSLVPAFKTAQQPKDIPGGFKDYRFQIALSFPGEARSRVGKIANALAEVLSRNTILYDDWLKPELARPNLDVYLTTLYKNDSFLLVVFLCEDYVRKDWCGLEWRVVRDLIKQRQDERVMLLKLDDAEVPGLLSIDGYLDIRSLSDPDITHAIVERYAMSNRFPGSTEPHFRPKPQDASPDLSRYIEQRGSLETSPVIAKIYERPRWCISICPADFKPARFRDLDQCERFVQSFGFGHHRHYPRVWPERLVKSGEWLTCESEDKGTYHLYLEAWALARSGQFVQNLALDEQHQIGDRTHVYEILDRVSVAYHLAAELFRECHLSGKIVLSFSFSNVDGRQLTQPLDQVGFQNNIPSNVWSQDRTFEIEHVADVQSLSLQYASMAVDTTLAIFAKFGWTGASRDHFRDTQATRAGML